MWGQGAQRWWRRRWLRWFRRRFELGVYGVVCLLCQGTFFGVGVKRKRLRKRVGRCRDYGCVGGLRRQREDLAFVNPDGAVLPALNSAVELHRHNTHAQAPVRRATNHHPQRVTNHHYPKSEAHLSTHRRHTHRRHKHLVQRYRCRCCFLTFPRFHGTSLIWPHSGGQCLVTCRHRRFEATLCEAHPALRLATLELGLVVRNKGVEVHLQRPRRLVALQC
mmetsp:Transcript_24217/g.49640  ORF Transcript_24217/g.49640 Transcript_24217/m.49640 type:complete len:220 (-) Transcript_24217:240-899(-)